MDMKIGLTFACLNMKKLAKIKRIRTRKHRFPEGKQPNLSIVYRVLQKKTNFMQSEVCLQSEANDNTFAFLLFY